MYYGIDYGLGGANIDRETGIRYGVIPMNALSEFAYESMEPDYGTPTCPKCGNEVIDYDSEKDGDDFEPYHRGSCSDHLCLNCKLVLGSDEVFGEEPLGWSIDDPDYEGAVHGGDGDLFVTKSPYYTHARFCSPCAPGACYLTDPVDKNGPRAYCLGHDWFEGDKAPYPVFRVSDGSFVKPGTK